MKDMVYRGRTPCKFILLSCFICSAIILYLVAMDLIKVNFQLIGNERNLNDSSNTSENQAIITTTVQPSITLFVRMAARLEKHRYRYYCDLLRTTVLYWPPSYGKTVVVLDEESEVDYLFAENITRLNKEHFPDYKLDVLYEPLPKDIWTFLACQSHQVTTVSFGAVSSLTCTQMTPWLVGWMATSPSSQQ